jgi:ketosteroid isomerase-like protein
MAETARLTEAQVQAWLDRYVEAWRSGDEAQIADLFSDDATYRYNPYDEPVSGRREIIKSWLGDGEPDVFDAQYHVLAINGDLAVAHGESIYYDKTRTNVANRYDNIFVLRFDEDGRCREFTEWFMEPRKAAAEATAGSASGD